MLGIAKNIKSENKKCELSYSEKVLLVVKGCAIGDSCGMELEGVSPSKCDIDVQEMHSLSKGMVSDDTILTCATAKALANGSDFGKAYKEYGTLYPLGGYGSRFYAWVNGAKCEEGSCGNGAAMRVGPCGCLSSKEDVEKEARLSAVPTHSHPEGIKGAVVTATCVWMAFNGYTKKEIGNYCNEMYPDSKYSPKNKYKRISKYRQTYGNPAVCSYTVPLAVTCFVESKDYEDCILKAIRCGWDTDTQAAIAGALAMAYYRKCSAESESVWEKIRTGEYSEMFCFLE